MLKAVARHTTQRWVMLYVERWLKAPMLGPMAPWPTGPRALPRAARFPVDRQHLPALRLRPVDDPGVPGCAVKRFADDVVVHCVTERQAHQVREAIGRRLADVGLLLHPDKTRIVYCKDYKRHLDYDQVTFTFCGYEFRPRKAYDKVRKRSFTGFLPAVAPGKLTDISRKVASMRLHRRTNTTLEVLAREVNPVLRGWLNYFTEFYPSAVSPIGRRMDPFFPPLFFFFFFFFFFLQMHGSNRDPMDSGRAVAAMTRSRLSMRRERGRTLAEHGYLTRTWRRHSTASTMTISWRHWARSRQRGG